MTKTRTTLSYVILTFGINAAVSMPADFSTAAAQQAQQGHAPIQQQSHHSAPPSHGQPSQAHGGAEQAQTSTITGSSAQSAVAVSIERKEFSSTHTGTFNGVAMHYNAVASTTIVNDNSGQPWASIFSVAYTKDGVANVADRPVTFVWNGGPGSSSVWLHIGALGPRILDISSDPEDDGAPPYNLIDNAASVLEVTDLVFVDPVGTGYSKALAGSGNAFWGLNSDAQSMAAFVRTWLRENKRWNSPKFLAGESYGSARVSLVLQQLDGGVNDTGINGVILIGPALDMSYLLALPGNETANIASLVTFAAAAWYHDKAETDAAGIKQYVDEVWQFATSDYVQALYQGRDANRELYDRVVRTYARYTSLDEDIVRKSNLRVPQARFRKELLRDEGFSIGGLDSRYKMRDANGLGDRPDTDASMVAVDTAFSVGIRTYLGTSLGVEMPGDYQILNMMANASWDWSRFPNTLGGGYLNVAPQLASQMRTNKDLRVFFAAGLYDITAPYLIAEDAIRRYGFAPERTEYQLFEAGHMMYLHEDSRAQLLASLRAFIVEQ